MGTILSYRPETLGKGKPSFTVHLPFILSPGRTIKREEAERTFKCLGYQFKLLGDQKHYILKIFGFSTEEEAKKGFNKARASLFWFGMNNFVGIDVSADLKGVNLASSPVAISDKEKELYKDKGWDFIEGNFIGTNPTILPEHKKIVGFYHGSVTITGDFNFSVFKASMIEAFSKNKSENIFNDEKLKLALEVFLSSHFEVGNRSKFILGITTLEILIGEDQASKPVLDLISDFLKSLKETEGGFKKDQRVAKDLMSLRGGLRGLRKKSIKQRIEKLVGENIIGDEKVLDPLGFAKKISSLYQYRSNLLHLGVLDPNLKKDDNERLLVQSNDLLQKANSSILKNLFLKAAE